MQRDTSTSNPATLQIPTVFLRSKRKTFLSDSCQTPAKTYEARRPLPRPPQNNNGQKLNLSIIQFTDGSKRNMLHLFRTTPHWFFKGFWTCQNCSVVWSPVDGLNAFLFPSAGKKNTLLVERTDSLCLLVVPAKTQMFYVLCSGYQTWQC